MKKALSILTCFCLVVAFGLAEAATTGKISGRVVDSKGEALPGANVTVEGTYRGATTDVDGYYVIVSVDPGTYELKASMVGYSMATKTDVRTNSDITTTVNFVLNEATLELGELTVVAERPLVEPDRTESRYVVTADDIAVLPIIRNLDNFVELEAGVNVDGSDRIRNAWTQGGSGEVTEYRLDGIQLTTMDGRREGRGTSSQTFRNVNPSAISEITVLAGGLNAEYGHIGAVSVVTLDGGRDFHGQGHYRFSPARQQHWGENFYQSPIHRDRLKSGDSAWENETDATGRRVHERPSSDYTDVQGHFMEASLSGPVGRDVSFFVSTQHDFQPTRLPAAQLRKPFNANTSYKLTTNLNPNLKLRAGGLYGKDKGRFTSGSNLLRASAVRHTNNARAIFLPEGESAAGSWLSTDNLIYVLATHTLSARTFYEVRLSRYSSTQDTLNVPTLTVDPTLDQDGWYYADTGQIQDYQLGAQTRYTLKVDLSSQVTRGHFVKAGLSLTRYDSYQTNFTETAGGKNRYIIHYGKYGEFGEGVTPWEFSGYVQDKMEFEGLIVNAGMRIERFWGEKVPLIPFQGAPMTNTLTRYQANTQYGDMKAYTWYMPRLGISHPITDKSKIHFFYGKYHTRPAFDLFFRNRWNTSGAASRDLNGNGQIDPAEVNNNMPLNDSFGSAYTIDNPSFQHAQVSTAFELGSEYNFISDYTLQTTAYYRVSNGFLSVQAMYFVDPTLGRKAKTRANGPRGHVTTRGLELALKKGLKHNFSFKASINMGWGERLTIGGTKPGNGETDIFPDASYIADPTRYWQEWTVDPNTGAEIPNPPTGEKLEELKAKAQAQVDIGLAGGQKAGAQHRTEFIKLWELPWLSSEDAQRLQGLYSISSTFWSVEGGRADARRTQGSLVLIYASPPDFGPGEMLWGSKIFGDLRINMIYRLYTGRIFDFSDPITSLNVKREGPTSSVTDLSIQKGFNIKNMKPLLYLEINNLFNQKIPSTQSQGGGVGSSSDYLRWGLVAPRPDDSIFQQYGDVNDYARYSGEPRQIFAGLRLTW